MSSQKKSFNFGRYVPSDQMLNKKVPDNPKYKNVKATVNTGRNVSRHLDELKEKHKNNILRKDEVFKRIKFSSFVKLAVNVLEEKKQVSGNLNILEAERNDNPYNEGIKLQDERANVLVGIGEIDVLNETKKPLVTQVQRENCNLYLLLDVRDRDEYLKSHIKTARHYPAALLSRSIGYETEDIKLFKNKVHHLIILYDNDESIASRVASTLVQRGYSNVFMISGGLKCIQDNYPNKFMAAISAELSSDAIKETISAIRIASPPKEYFSDHDLNVIQQYIEIFLNKETNQLPITETLPRSRQSVISSDKKQDVSKYREDQLGSLTYRKNSACSIHSSSQAQKNSDNFYEIRLKSGKSTPWR